jgi:cytochrome c2
MNSIAKRTLLIGIAGTLSFFNPSMAQDGESIFKAKCSACHRVDGKKLVGPGLGNIGDKRSQEWLISWIKDSQKLIKSGDADAIAVYEEYSKIAMQGFPELTDAEIISMIDFLKTDEAPANGETAEVVAEEPEIPIEYTKNDVESGAKLFSGSQRFENKGPSCVVCHNVTNNAVIPGGLLAKDLTEVFGRMGHAGIGGILSAPPFPAMAESYSNNPLTETEIFQLTAFFKDANENIGSQKIDNGYQILAIGGGAGLIILFLAINMIWLKRKKEQTKKDIFARQIKGNDSIEY